MNAQEVLSIEIISFQPFVISFPRMRIAAMIFHTCFCYLLAIHTVFLYSAYKVRISVDGSKCVYLQVS